MVICMKKIDFLKNNLIAHRGLHDEKNPENSIGAFKKAINKGYIIELDVHLLKDNTVVVFHDDSLYRMTGKRKKIKDLTYDEIKEFRLLNTNYKVPTLKSVLELVDGKVPLIIEIKYDLKVGLLEKEVVKLLDNYEGKFCVKSFSPLSVRWFKKNRPNYIRGLLISSKKKTIKERILRSYLIFLLSKPDFISCNYLLYNDKKIKKYMKKVPVIAWTIKTENLFLRYKDKFYNLIVEKIL